MNPLPALHAFAAHLQARARRGEQRVWMSPEARAALKEIIRMRPGRLIFQSQETPAIPATPPPAPEPASAPPPALVQATVSTPAPISLPPAPLADKRPRLAAVAARAEAAPAARALGTLREKMVFATGSPDAQIVFVGEAPGAEEENQGEPFVGAAGQLLNKVLKAMGLERSEVYITNICKFRPAAGSRTGRQTGNRNPTGIEMSSCIEFVQEELAIIRPRVIVALGKTAVEGLLEREVAITRLRGQWQEYRGIPLMPTFHPSYLLHKESDGEVLALAEKRKHWEDMLQVMERLGMNVSEKQRRFFLSRM